MATAITIPDKIATAILVLGGEYGNGEERKEKLRKDGFDPEEIQAIVNKLYPIFMNV